MKRSEAAGGHLLTMKNNGVADKWLRSSASKLGGLVSADV
jgi:hypothetical protein